MSNAPPSSGTGPSSIRSLFSSFTNVRPCVADRFWLDTLFNPGDSPDSTAGQANGGTSTAVQGALELANLGGRPSLAPSTDDNSVPDSNRFWSGPKDPPSTRPTSRYSTDGEARASTPSLQLPSATDEANSSYNPGGNTSSLDVGINPSSGKSVNTLSSIASSTGQKGYKDHHDRHDRDMIGLGGWSEECGNVGPIPRQIELSDTTSRRSNTFPICESDSPLPTSQGSVRLHGSRSNYNVDRLNLCSERHNSIVPRGDQSSLSASAISGSGAELRVTKIVQRLRRRATPPGRYDEEHATGGNFERETPGTRSNKIQTFLWKFFVGVVAVVIIAMLSIAIYDTIFLKDGVQAMKEIAKKLGEVCIERGCRKDEESDAKETSVSRHMM